MAVKNIFYLANVKMCYSLWYKPISFKYLIIISGLMVSKSTFMFATSKYLLLTGCKSMQSIRICFIEKGASQPTHFSIVSLVRSQEWVEREWPILHLAITMKCLYITGTYENFLFEDRVLWNVLYVTRSY